MEGLTEGQTQIDTSCKLGFACWSHPIDIHLTTKGIQGMEYKLFFQRLFHSPDRYLYLGWPKLIIEVWYRDQLERCSLISYGLVNIPSQPGFNTITCHTWRPVGSIVDKLANLFGGETLQLAEDSFVYSHEHRFNLKTETMGQVCFELNIILKDFDKFGVETH